MKITRSVQGIPLAEIFLYCSNNNLDLDVKKMEIVLFEVEAYNGRTEKT